VRVVPEGKTIRQIAEEIGIDKQRVYRYIRRNRISEAHQEAGAMWYSEADERLIKQGLIDIEHITEAHHDAHQTASSDAVIDTLITALKSQLEIKDKQIEMKDQQIISRDKQISELTAALEHTTASLQAAQALHAGTIQNQLTSGGAEREEEPPQTKKGWRFWKK